MDDAKHEAEEPGTFQYVSATLIAKLNLADFQNAVLSRRIARAHGFQRTGSRIRERLETLDTKAHRMTEEEVGTFYWPNGRGPEAPLAFRRAADAAARTVDEICMPELAALAREVLDSGKEGEAAIVAMARELGLHSLRAVSRGRIEKAVREAGSQK